MNVRIKLLIGLCVLALAGLSAGCSGDSTNTNTAATNPADANVNASPANPTMAQNPTGTDPTQNMQPQPNPPRAGADDSEIQTTMDSNGDVVETRTFKNNKNVTKIVRTTKGTNSTVKVYNAKGESRDLPKDKVKDAMTETGDALASAAGWTVEKSKDAASATKDVAVTAADKTKEGARTVGEGAKTVGEKTVEGAKTVGEKTAEGAKKGAKKVKDALTP